jgi:hypothetical protein
VASITRELRGGATLKISSAVDEQHGGGIVADGR